MLNKKPISILQISLMVIAIFAFAFILDGAFVGAEDPGEENTAGKQCKDAGGTCTFSPCSSYGISSVSPNDCGSGKSCCSLTEYISHQTAVEEKNFQSEGDQAISDEELSELGYDFQEGKATDGGKTPLPADKNQDNLKDKLGEQASRELIDQVTEKTKEILENPKEEKKDSSLGGKLGDFAKDIFKGYFRGFNLNYPIYSKKAVSEIGEEKLTEEFANQISKKLGAEATKEEIQKEATKQLSKSTISQSAVYLNSFAWAMTGANVYLQAIQLFGSGERNVRTIQKSQLASVPLGTAAGIMAVSAGIPGPGWIAAGVTATVMGFWTAFTHQDYSREVFVYDVQGWQPPVGGEHCYECNDLKYGCSEYQCNTFGTACELINEGSDEERCVWVNEDDIKPPEISSLDNLDEGFSYSPSNQVDSPNRGVDLLYEGGCIDPFTSVKFAVKTDEPAQCKLDVKRNPFENMSSSMNEGSRFTENHTMEIPASAIPSASALEEIGWSVDAGKDYSFYISCRDYNGNVAPYHFVVNFCVDDGPDTSPPIITGTNYLNGEYIESGTSSISDFDIYTNEPADCKWDYKDLDYESMGYEFEDCSSEIGDYLFSDTFTYGCEGVLSGLKDNEKNTFYMRCKDKPGLTEENDKETRVANSESYKLDLFGTKDLAIKSIKVNDMEDGAEIRDSTDKIKAVLSVETIEGANEGDAKCTYKESRDVLFYDFDSNSEGENFLNEHTLRLEEGDYFYDISCFDRAGNTAEGNISFTIDQDTDEPIVARAYYENNKIVLVTTENATCTYNTKSCDQSYVDSIEITSSDNVNHYLAWDTEQDLFIKCQDIYKNRPDPGVCNIVVRGHELYSISEED